MPKQTSLLARLLHFRAPRRRHRNDQFVTQDQQALEYQDSQAAAHIAQPGSPRGAMGDVLTPTLDDAQPLAQPAGAQDAGPGLKLPILPNTLPSPATALRRDSLQPPSDSHNSVQTMAAPTITVEHTANASPLDNLSEVLATKTCFAFVLDTTLYDHRAATSLATRALLQAVADSHNAPYDTLQATYADLCSSHPPSAQENWAVHQKQLLQDLLASIPHALTPEQASAQIDDLFRLWKKTMYAQLHPAPGVLPLLRSLLKRSARIVIAIDSANSGCTNDMAAWLIEHLYLDNFVDRIAVLEESNTDDGSNGSSNSDNGFGDVLKRIDVRPDETVLFAGARRDGRSIAAREGVSLVVVDAEVVAQHPEDVRGRMSGKNNYVRQADDGVWEIGALMVARNAVRMTLHERDRSVDSARM
ncbi:haloacid dehalogenase domain-containing protein hydrolase [Diplodia corticola]|uniref:Haloacid dehalogenase domain-containing protein hydrolase n=1 Tax=Diplodia corticola TaxID=236234 RepID=A0A1J9RAK9_9PEZI|nr:haloacid dehalogenase domain-containing protein hydrolase [Diplodia corticola]OJD37584.1 haloacid dehalogenase domain-containing protein hydrolase [Diplodia corticola]